MAHDGFGNDMLVSNMDKAISKGYLIVEINNTTTKNPLPCSMDDYNKMRGDSKFQHYLLLLYTHVIWIIPPYHWKMHHKLIMILMCLICLTKKTTRMQSMKMMVIVIALPRTPLITYHLHKKCFSFTGDEKLKNDKKNYQMGRSK